MAELQQSMQLIDWLNDICVRFIINLPYEELQSVERIIFQIEEGHWYYEDFIRPLNPALPFINLKNFCALIFASCPLLAEFSDYWQIAHDAFSAYKTRVPVRGAIMLNQDMSQVVLVKGWKRGAKWSFPRGKINKGESDYDCAIREVYEETGYDIRQAGLASSETNAKYIDVTLREQQMRLYVIRNVPVDTEFEPRTRKEISRIDWYNITDLPGGKSRKHAQPHDNGRNSSFYMVAPFIGQLKAWIKQSKKKDMLNSTQASELLLVDDSGLGTDIELMPPELSDSQINAESRHFQSLLSSLNHPSQSTVSAHELRPTILSNHDPTEELAAQLKKLLNVGDSHATQPKHECMPQVDSSRSLIALLQTPSSSSILSQTPYNQVRGSSSEAIPFHYQTHTSPRQLDSNAPIAPIPPKASYISNVQAQSADAPHALQPVQSKIYQQATPYDPRGLPRASEYDTVPAHASGSSSLRHSPRQQLAQTGSSAMPAQFVKTVPYRSGVHPAVSRSTRLTPHSLSLLNAFKSPSPSRDSSCHQPQVRKAEDHVQQLSHDTTLSPSLPHVFGVPSKAHTVQMSDGLNVRPSLTPHSTTPQANTLLNLFRSGTNSSISTLEVTPQSAELAPSIAELSAGTPQIRIMKKSQPRAAQKPPSSLLPSFPTSASNYLTSATVSGPLNSQNLDPMTHDKLSSDFGKDQELSASIPIRTIGPDVQLEAPQALHPPTILQRQYTPVINNPVSSTSTPGPFDRRATTTIDQQSALMALFNKKPSRPISRQQSQIFGGNSSFHMGRQGQTSSVSSPPRGKMLVHQISGRLENMVPPYDALADSQTPNKSMNKEKNGIGHKSSIKPAERNFLLQYLTNVAEKEGYSTR